MEAEDHIVKRYHSISEVAKKLGVNTSLIRFWEKEFPQIKPKKNRKGNRQFTIEDVSYLETIYDLVKVKGYTLIGARNYLKQGKKTTPDNNNHSAVIDKLTSVKQRLSLLKNQL